MTLQIFKITKDDNDRRIDRVVRHFLPSMPLSGIYKLLRKGLIRVDGKKVGPEFHVLEGSSLGIAGALLNTVRIIDEPQKTRFVPEILLETTDLLIINKPAGIPVHGENGLDQLIPQTASSNASLSFRTGPLHRLDRDTTGLLAFSRSLEGARWFSHAVSEHLFEKYYLGIVEGILVGESEWRDVAEDGKNMQTCVKPLVSNRRGPAPLTLVRFRIITGRKHQIRIQSSLRAHPLFGDVRYGSVNKNTAYFLHAWRLVFPPERLTDIPADLTAPLPPRFNSMIKETFGPDVLAHIEHGELYWK